MLRLTLCFLLLVLCSLARPVVAAVNGNLYPSVTLNIDGIADYMPGSGIGNVAGLFRPIGSDGNTPYSGTLSPNGYPSISGHTLSYMAGLPAGDYPVTWTGSGIVTLTGPSSKQTWTRTGPNSGVWHFATRPSPLGQISDIYGLDFSGQIDNLKIIAPDIVTGTSYRKPFLDSIKQIVKPNSVVRYMDLMKTNGSPVTSWESRTQPTFMYRTNANGIAYEEIAELANLTDTTPWLTIPLNATDDYVRKLAQLMKTNLKPGLKVRYQLSNELWNSGMPHFAQHLTNARNNPLLTKSDDYGRMGQQEGFRLKQIDDIMRSELGDARTVPVMGGFIANKYWGSWGLDQIKSMGGNASRYLLAIAPYAPGSETDLVGLSSSSTIPQIVQAVRNFMNGWVKTAIIDNKALADSYGVKLVSYEADVASFYALNQQVSIALLPKFIELQNDPALYQLTLDFMQMCKEAGLDEYAQFGLAGTRDKYGQWAAKSDTLELSSPQFDALRDVTTAQVPEPRMTMWLMVIIGMGCMTRSRRRNASALTLV